MRREIFLGSGGFDENYRGASIAEDTEFGQRAWARGINIRLDPNIRVVHLKKYSAGGVLREDFLRARALVSLRLRKWGQPFFTSVPTFYQLAVPISYLALLGFIATPLLGISSLRFSSALLIAFYLLNLPWLGFLFRIRGFRFGILSALFWLADALIVGAGMLAAVLDFARGNRY
jgi:GT2 family glycosyltransferase